MRIAKPEGRAPGSPRLVRDPPTRRAIVTKHGRRAIELVRSGTAALSARVPGTMHASRSWAQETTTALQALPDPTLRWLAAASVGLGTGLHLAGAPRMVTAAGLAPAALMGAAIVLRPGEPVVPREAPDPEGSHPEQRAVAS